MLVSVVFAHGAFHGPWCWERVQARLGDHGIVSSASDLCRQTSAEDAAVLQADVDAASGDGPPVVVGHSLGGLAVSALTPASASHLVYLSALLPGDTSEQPQPPDVTEAVAEGFFGALGRDDSGRSTIDPAATGELFYHDCTPEDAAWAASQLRPHMLGGAALELSRAAWRDTESTYIVCNADRVLRPAYQRKAAAMVDHTMELTGSHSPMLARPAELAVAIARIVRDVSP